MCVCVCVLDQILGIGQTFVFLFFFSEQVNLQKDDLQYGFMYILASFLFFLIFWWGGGD